MRRITKLLTARVCDTGIRISFFFAAVVTLALILDRTGTALITLCAAVIHETGHLLCLLWFGEAPRLICLEPFGMRITRRGNIGVGLGCEAAIALAGPCANLLLAAVLAIVGLCFGAAGLKRAVAVNLAIALFNLLPIHPLDAGRALYHLLCIRMNTVSAERTVTVVGFVLIVPLAAAGVFVLIKSRYNISLLLASVYLALLLIRG